MTSKDFSKKIERQSILTRNRMIVEVVKRGKAVSTSGSLVTSLKNNSKVVKKQGIPFKIKYSFMRQGIFIRLGVGRGTTIAQAAAGNSKRDKVDWYKPIVLQDYAKFGDLWQQYWAEKMMEELAESLDNLEK